MKQQFHFGAFPENTKTLIQKDICIPTSTATLFTVDKIYMPINQSTDEEDVINVHNRIFLSQEKNRIPVSGNIIHGPKGYYAK